jgi:LacI family transcriptional regulator
MSAGRSERSRRYASLKEVAAAAGVSFQTASKVLNGGKVRVSAQTEERILAAARELGYSPNTIARSLVRRSTCTLGLIASDMADGALARFAVAAEREARRHGHAVLVGNLGPGGEDGADVVRMLIERRVDGLIAAAPQLEDDLVVAEMLRSRIPTVSMHHVPGGGVPVLGSNHRDTGRLAVGHLVRLGHRRIGTVAGPLRRRVVRSRLRGYEDTLREAGLEPAEDLVVEADWTAGGAAAATRLLLERERTLTAVFVHSDTMAIGVLSALAAAGRRVPGDVAVVGCDDMPFAEYLIPALTSVRVPFEETGQQAVRLLLARIRGPGSERGPGDERGDGPGREHSPGDGRGNEGGSEDGRADPVLLPVELIVRESCGGRTEHAGPS